MKSFSQEQLDKIAKLLSTAVESPDGMRALAAAIAEPIRQSIETREIASLLFSRHDLPRGERATYQKRPTVRAFWVSVDGDAREVGIDQEDVDIPTGRIHSNPMVDKSTLKHGNIGSLADILKETANTIRKEIDRRAVSVLSAAVPGGNVVTITGGKLTEEGLNQGISILEDKELTVKYIVMRGRRFNDIRSWQNLDPETRLELRQKGIIKNWGTGGILLTSACALDEVLLVPEDEIGKYPVKEKLNTEPIDAALRFKIGWLAWQECGFGVTRPDLCVKLRITS